MKMELSGPRSQRDLLIMIDASEEGELRTQLISEYESLYGKPNISVRGRQNIGPDTLLKDAFETYMKQIYGLPIVIPKFLIINGLKCDFITFEETEKMLHDGKVDRLIIDPIIQPWIGSPISPNRIVTIFSKNGTTHLVIAKFNMQTNKIYAPV